MSCDGLDTGNGEERRLGNNAEALGTCHWVGDSDMS